MLKFLSLVLISSTLLYFISSKASSEISIGRTGNEYVNFSDTLNLPFDTTKVLALLPYPIEDISKNMPSDIDTFELTNLMYACDCPSWATKEMLKLTEEERVELSKLEKEEIFYIERGDKSISVPDMISLNQNKIRFYGKINTKENLPNEGLMDPNPKPGKVFTYFGYELILPAVIRGPEVFVPDTANGKPAWDKYEPSYLVVTKTNYPKSRSKY